MLHHTCQLKLGADWFHHRHSGAAHIFRQSVLTNCTQNQVQEVPPQTHNWRYWCSYSIQLGQQHRLGSHRLRHGVLDYWSQVSGCRRSAIRSKYKGNIGAKNMRRPMKVITLGSPKP